MLKRSVLTTALTVIALTAAARLADAGGSPQEKCAAAKLKAAGKGISGEMGCHAKGKAKAPFTTDPNCLTKVQSKTAAAVGKAGGTCAGTATSVQADITSCVSTLLPDVPGTDKCPSASTKAVGKGGGALLACQSKEVTKPGSFAACDTKADGKTQGAITKAGTCGQAPFTTIHTHLHTCDAAILNGIVPPPTTSTTSTSTSSTTSSSSSTSTSSTTSSSTTTSTIACACCGNSRLGFATNSSFGTPTGTVLDDTGSLVTNLVANGLYFGGGLDGVPLPARIPDYGAFFAKITSCNPGTGALTLGPTTVGEVGNRSCTSAGCLYGPPLPIPNTTGTPTSTCVINVVATDAVGSANCAGATVASLNIPLSSGIYLTGDMLPSVNGIQPCPLCDIGTLKCQGGPNNGLACLPTSSPLGDAYPVSYDCPPPPAAYLGALPIGYDLTTGTQTRTAFDNLPTQSNVFCGFCATSAGVFQNPAQACTTNGNCTTGSFTRCRQRSGGAFMTDFAGLNTARTISESGSTAGVCLADNALHAMTLVSVFCIPPTYNGLVDGSADLPGPGAAALAGDAQLVP